jgi:hypothetical protein
MLFCFVDSSEIQGMKCSMRCTLWMGVLISLVTWLLLLRYDCVRNWFFWPIPLHLSTAHVAPISWEMCFIRLCIGVGAIPVAFLGFLLQASDRTGFTINAIREMSLPCGLTLLVMFFVWPLHRKIQPLSTVPQTNNSIVLALVSALCVCFGIVFSTALIY